MWNSIKIFMAFGALVGTAGAVGLPEVPFQGDLRLRLKDLSQERRTTSINWWDLKETPQNNPVPLSSGRPIRIVIDPGHGGHDWGAPGHHGLVEKDVSLTVARALRRELERTAKWQNIPVKVVLSRNRDVFLSLKDRVALANSWRADLFLSIHANASPSPRLHGFEVYFQSNEATDDHSNRLAWIENRQADKPVHEGALAILSDALATRQIQQSSEFAERVYSAMSRRLRPNVRGVRQAPFTVLAGAEMPALLVEIGYVTHPQEARNLKNPSYLKRIADAINTGVFEFIRMLRNRMS